MFRLHNAPMYDPEAVRPMREELTKAGIEEILTPEDVDRVVGGTKGTVLVVVNSVCGCAAGIFRPGVVRALGHRVKPDRSVTVFAGMERDAVERVRALAASVPPSSPCAYLFKDGTLAAAIPRREIEGRSPDVIASALTGLFERHCASSAAPAADSARR